MTIKCRPDKTRCVVSRLNDPTQIIRMKMNFVRFTSSYPKYHQNPKPKPTKTKEPPINILINYLLLKFSNLPTNTLQLSVLEVGKYSKFIRNERT